MAQTTKETLQDLIFSTIQLASFPLILLIKIVLNPRVEYPKDLKVPPGTLIISNHQSWIDPWFVGCLLGFRNILSVIPFRFPVTPNFYRKHIWGHIIWLFGGFDIGQTQIERAKKLLYIRDLIHKNYTVLIFPEGQWVRNEKERVEFKKGIQMLAREDRPMLLAQISNLHNNLFAYKFRRSGIRIRYSEIINDGSVDEKMQKIQTFYGLNEKIHAIIPEHAILAEQQ